MDAQAFQPSIPLSSSLADEFIGRKRFQPQCCVLPPLSRTCQILAVATPKGASASRSQSFPGASSADTSLGIGEQISRTLETIGDKVSDASAVSLSRADAFLDESKQEVLEAEEFLKITSSATDVSVAEISTEDSWNPEQSVLLSLFSDDYEPWHEPPLPTTTSRLSMTGGSADSSMYGSESIGMSGALESVLAESSPFEQQVNPCLLNAADMKRRMSALKRRRHRLAIERGEEAEVAMDSHLFASQDPSIPMVDMMNSVDRENAKNSISFSLARASILDLSAPASSRANALTTNSEHLAREAMHCPFRFRPFFGMQIAFEHLDSPPCPRCRRPAPKMDLLKFEALCGQCYKEIYLEEASLISTNSSRGSWEKSENNPEEARAVEEAVSVSKNLLRSQSFPSRSDEQPSGTVTTAMRQGQQSRGRARKVSEGKSRSSVLSQHSGNTGNNVPSISESPVVDDGWNVRASQRSMRTINPIRNLIQNIDVKPNPDKDLIKLSVGDPTVYRNLKVSEKAIRRFCEVIQSNSANGYSMSMGSEEARSAVAKRYTSPQSQLVAEDVILTGGTSGALEIAIGAIANEGDNVLLPRPGFPLFRTIAEGYGVECRYYDVKPEKNWEIELSDLVELSDSRTVAIIVNNPSNPCGSVFSAAHVEDLLATASMLKIPIIADEVYADMVFSNRKFTPIASKSVDVPVLSVGGVSKQCVVPGWRLGWILIHDRHNVLEVGGMRKGMRQLTTRMLVPNTPVQAVLPTLLADKTQDVALRAIMDELEENANFTMKALASARGVRCIEPQGAMYVMAEIDVLLLGFKDDMEFTEKLLEEEAVFVLPGQCFQAPNFVRIVFSAPKQILSEAFFRIRSFCARHSGSL